MFGRSSKKVVLLVSLVFVIALLVSLIGTVSAQPQDQRVRKVIVFEDDFTNARAQKGLLKNFEIIHELPIANAMAVLLPEKAIAALTARTEVRSVEDDGIVWATRHGGDHKPKPDPEPDPTNSQITPWGVDAINAVNIWDDPNTGFGIKVAVIDSGIDNDHPDLIVTGGFLAITSGKYSKKANNPESRSAWDDDNGHGTHVAGTIAAKNNLIGVVGVSPDVELHAVKVLSNNGFGSWIDVVAGIQWAVDNGMQIVNMSLGGSSAPDYFITAVKKAYDNGNGLVIVASAGNSGPDENTVGFPAKMTTETIAVAASDSSNTIANFSSRGPQVDITAPGYAVLSTTFDGLTGIKSGTSMAAPHVTGVAALMLTAKPSMNAKDIQDILKNTAIDLNAVGWDSASGFGLVNPLEAVQY